MAASSDSDQDEQFLTDDERRAAMLAPSFSPPDPRQAPDPSQPGSSNYNGPQLVRRDQPAAAAATPTPQQVSPASDSSTQQGAAKTWKDYVAQGLAGQSTNTQRADQTAQALAAQPDEASVVAPLQAKSDALGQPIDPRSQQYKPGIGTRIIRGIDAFRRGGVLGTVDPADVGGTAYGAPNKNYGIDTAQRQGQKAVVDSDIQKAQKAYEDATARAKAIRSEQGAVATGYKDLGDSATKQEVEENTAGRDTETARHNRATETTQSANETSEAANRTAENANRKAQLGIEASRLSLERKKAEFEMAGGAPGANTPLRQEAIDKATEAVQSYKDGWEYNADTNTYTGNGKVVTPQQYVDGMNRISSALDLQLGSKKLPPLNLRWKAGPNGQEIPVQQPGATQQTVPAGGAPTPQPAAPAQQNNPAAAPKIKLSSSGQMVGVGDTVLYKGQQRVVKTVDPKTGKVTAFQ